MPKISDERKDERRGQIFDGARRCFAEHGYEGATVTRLEQAIGLSRGAIFNYYASKDDLFLALTTLDAERIGTLWLEQGFGGMLRALLTEDPAWLTVYLEATRRIGTDEGFRERWRQRVPGLDEQIKAKVEQARADGEIRDDVPLDTIGRFMGIVSDGLALRIAAGFPLDDADGLLDLIEDAIRPRGRVRKRTPERRSA